jgi:hypothetical protein
MVTGSRSTVEERGFKPRERTSIKNLGALAPASVRSAVNDDPQTSSPKQGPINFFLTLVVFIMATFPIAISWILFFGKI